MRALLWDDAVANASRARSGSEARRADGAGHHVGVGRVLRTRGFSAGALKRAAWGGDAARLVADRTPSIFVPPAHTLIWSTLPRSTSPSTPPLTPPLTIEAQLQAPANINARALLRGDAPALTRYRSDPRGLWSAAHHGAVRRILLTAGTDADKPKPKHILAIADGDAAVLPLDAPLQQASVPRGEDTEEQGPEEEEARSRRGRTAALLLLIT
jgi:hypothetical protein